MSFKSSFPTPAVAAISLGLIGGTVPAPAYADLGDQLFKLLADDEGGFDMFGGSVAISGATAIIGAERDRDYGTEAGSAYLFDTTTGQQIAELRANDVAPYDSLGWSVAISGTTAIVGAPGHEHDGTGKSSAYLFDIITGKQIAELLPGDATPGAGFGRSVAISHTTAIVGAWVDDNNGVASGSAYLFDVSDPKNPIQIARLLPDDGAAHDRFGWSVGISGTTAIVGAYRHEDNGTESGSAYLFDTASGRQLVKLLPDDGAAHDRFGWFVAISPDGIGTAIVGAYYNDDNGQNSGSAYLFDTATGRQLFKLLPDDGAEGENFGWSVGISGATAIVGARRDDDNGHWSGSAYLFDTASGRQLVKLLPDDGAVDDTFGVSVAIDGSTAIVGAEEDDDNGNHSGSAYLFDAAGTPTCPWDLHGDGIVGPGDLLILLGWWGFDPGGPPDFDGDGNVGASDLLALLVNWGPCP